jgi:integrase
MGPDGRLVQGVPMASVKDGFYRFVCKDRDRHGNVRFYFRRKGLPKIRLNGAPDTPEFAASYQAALAKSQGELTTIPDQPRRPIRGTYRWLCTQYFASARFRQLDERTQKVRRQVLEKTFDEPIAPGTPETFGDCPLSKFTRKAVRILRDRRADKTEAANERLKAIRQAFAWAIEEEQEGVHDNPTHDVPYLKGRVGGHHSWTPEEVAQFEKRHPIGTKARLAMALLLYTGQRRSDIVLFGKQHIRDGWLRFTQQKNRNRRPITLALPVLPVLQDIIDQSPAGDLTFLVTEHGAPYTFNGFGNWFGRQCRLAGLKNCSAHGLRKAGAVIAAENGATAHQLMSIFGWLTLKQAELYTRAAEQKRIARDAMPLLQRERNAD